MGGQNQATCPPSGSSQSAQSRLASKGAKGVKTPVVASNPIRFHEATGRGEVDFHDDVAGLKCAVDSASFFSAYNRWRSTMSEELILAGNDGSGGHASVTFLPYVDDVGELQVSMVVAKAKIGQTVVDLDILAHFP